MAAGYDGTIRIDTRVDTAGLNAGTKVVSTKLQGLSKILSSVGAGLVKGFQAVLKIVATIGKVIAAGAIVAIIAMITAIMAVVRGAMDLGKALVGASKKGLDAAQKIEELKQTFANLKVAVSDAFRPLVLAAMPWITAVTNALINLLNMVAQVTAYLTGQEGYWKTTAASVEQASGSAANATEEMKGSLADFDKLNVLQQPEEPTGGGGGTGENVQEWVEIGTEAESLGEKIKKVWERIKEFFAPLTDAFGRLWDAIKNLWEALKPVFEIIWVATRILPSHGGGGIYDMRRAA